VEWFLRRLLSQLQAVAQELDFSGWAVVMANCHVPAVRLCWHDAFANNHWVLHGTNDGHIKKARTFATKGYNETRFDDTMLMR